MDQSFVNEAQFPALPDYNAPSIAFKPRIFFPSADKRILSARNYTSRVIPRKNTSEMWNNVFSFEENRFRSVYLVWIKLHGYLDNFRELSNGRIGKYFTNDTLFYNRSLRCDNCKPSNGFSERGKNLIPRFLSIFARRTVLLA